MKTPLSEGIPLIVMTSEDQEAVTPAGKFVGVPMPDALVVVCVILVIAVLGQTVGVAEAAPTELDKLTVIIPVAFALPQRPVNGIE